jgi:hypothetical protein
MSFKVVLFLNFLIKGLNPGFPHVNMTSNTGETINDTENKNGNITKLLYYT